MRGYTRWTDNDVLVWAYMYLAHESTTLTSMENSMGISHSTIWVGFRRRLERNDPDLYGKVLEKFEQNKHHGGRRVTSKQ